MKSILNNPYRVAGLLAGATAREIRAKFRNSHKYVEAGEIPPNLIDDSLPVLGELILTKELLNETESKLNLDSDILEAALFWFYNANFKDEAAIEFLKNKNKQGALDIWQKSTSSRLISENNWSAFHNLSTLYLWESTSGKKTIGTATDFLEKGISLKIKFLESNFAKEFVSLIAGKTCSIKPVELEKMFLQTVKRNIEQDQKITLEKLINILTKINFVVKDEFIKGFTQTFVSEIERQVEATAKKRQADPSKAVNEGTELYKNVADRLKQLKEIRGENDLQYSSVADKVANELLQCAFDNFKDFQSKINTDLEQVLLKLTKIIERKLPPSAHNAHRILIEAKPLLLQLQKATGTNSSSYSSSETEKLLKQGQSIAVGKMVKNRYEENVKIITQGIDTNNIYLNISTRIASDAEQMCISEVNANSSSSDIDGLIKLREVVLKALEVYRIIGEMNLLSEYETAFYTRKKQLSDLLDQLPSSYDLDRAARYKQQEEEKKERAARRSNWIFGICIVLGMIIGLIYGIPGGVGNIIGGLVLGFLGGSFLAWIISR